MKKKYTEIIATWSKEKQRWPNASGDALIGEAIVEDEAGRVITIKCTEDEDQQPELYQTYRFYGSWSNYTNKRTGQIEPQFQAQTFVKVQPHSRAGIITYLGKTPNIGPIFASRLYEKFSGKAVKILREQPEVAAASVDRLSEDAAKEASAWLEREKALEDCTIDLIDLLDGRGFPKTVYKQAIKKWGNTAADKIREKPYRLAVNFRGCGFKRADALYLDLGYPPAALIRQGLCAWYAISSQSEGHTWYYGEVARKALKGAIAGAEVQPERAIEFSLRGRILSATLTDGMNGPPHWDGNQVWLADARKARNERRLARYIAEAMLDTIRWPDISQLAPALRDEEGGCHQYDTLKSCITAPLTILGGSPGTGKTYTAAQLIRILISHFGAHQIGVAAPTGKAAVRLSEALNTYKLPLRAKTLHSLLGVLSSDGGWKFNYNAGNPLPFKVLVVDESSMLDTDLAASFFAARAPGTLILLIGDTNQLPPVGHGAPLRDMIAAGIPYGELRKIRRNSGAIVEACAEIRDGRSFKTGGNLIGVSPKSTEITERMLDVIAQSGVKDPVWDCQVLCAVNEKSKLARKELNKILQNNLNPNPSIKDQPFRIGDKVVNTKNGWFPKAEEWLKKKAIAGDDIYWETNENEQDQVVTNEDGRIYVANGELGKVVEVQPKFFIATLASPFRAVIVPRGGEGAGVTEKENAEGDLEEESTGTGCNWDLGYALSTHKAQGSEWPVVIVMIDESPAAARICTREHIYTSISRAKETCYLIGPEAVAQGFVRKTALDKRKTFLTHFIKEELKCQST